MTGYITAIFQGDGHLMPLYEIRYIDDGLPYHRWVTQDQLRKA